MVQKEFATHVASIIARDPGVIGLAAGGSYITGDLDEYSDLDLILVTEKRIAGNTQQMIAYAKEFGSLLSAFTGEHVNEPRLLICLYDEPLIHVDIKFLTLAEFHDRVENPVVLYEKDNALTAVIASTTAQWPVLDYQWIEDRFWTWIHYILMKIGRGELLEAFDALAMLRSLVLSPLMQVRNKKLPRGLRRVETELTAADLENLKITIAQYKRDSILKALDNCVSIYRNLRRKLFMEDVEQRTLAEKKVMDYFRQVKASN